MNGTVHENEKRLCSKYKIIRSTCNEDELKELVAYVEERKAEKPEWKNEWTNEAILRRFICAYGQLKAVKKAVETYLVWRVEKNLEAFTEDDPDIAREHSQGRSYILEQTDYCGRPIMVVFARNHDRNHGNYDSLFKYLLFLLEELCKRADKTEHKSFTLIFDLKGFEMRNMDFHYVKTILNYLNNFYPERLGTAFIINYPKLFYGCWNVIKYWMNDVTRSRIVFAGQAELEDFIDLEKLPYKFFH